MKVILVPGLWLDASSWDSSLPALEAAGHHAVPLTMPGVGEPAELSADIGIDDWVAAVVAEIDAAEIDAADRDIVLVGHSGGGNVVWAAADARPDAVRRVIFVDTVPPPPGYDISEFPVVDGVVPFPDWSAFDEPDISDLDAPTRARIETVARTVPARVPTDKLRLGEGRRHQVPVTILSGWMTEESLREALSAWGPWADEFDAIEDVEVIRLGTGHWPQFSQPEAFATALAAAVR